MKRLSIVIGTIITLVLVAGAIIWYTQKTGTTQTPVSPEVSSKVGNEVSRPLPQYPDTDGDGLFDSEEIRSGTDPQNPDTDGDGLSDWQERAIHRTNPLNPDTDGDGFTDGEEVKNGYNPKGPGRL